MDEPLVSRLAETLLDLGSSAATGVLRLGTSGHFRMAFFEEGRLVYLVSDVEGESLAASFVRAGRLERAHERLALFQLEKEVTRKKSLVSLLLDSELRDADTVRAWLVEYAFEVFARVFDSRDVAWKFTKGVRAEHPLPYSIATVEVVLEAIHGMTDDETIHDAVGPLTQVTRPSQPMAERDDVPPLSFYEGLVAARVTGTASLEDVVAASGIPEPDALRALLALRSIGVLEPFSESKRLRESGLLRLLSADARDFVVDVNAPYEFVDDSVTDGAIVLGEHDERAVEPPVATSWPEPRQIAVRPRGSSAPLQYPPPKPRGDTSRLRLLASAYIQMGEAEAAAGNFTAATECFESALAQKPNDLPTLLAYASVHAKRPGGVATAERLLETACAAHPKKAAPRIQLARIYLATGREDEAEDELLEAKRVEPGNGEVRSLLDGVARRQGGGLLAKLGFRSEAKPKPTMPRAAPIRLVQPTSGDEPQLRCKYCGRLVQGEARVCRSCGATL